MLKQGDRLGRAARVPVGRAEAIMRGIARSGLGRVVYALSTKQLIELNPQSGDWPAVTQDGPALFDEARAPIDAYYRPC